MKELKLTPGQRAALKLKIGREMERNPEFAAKVLNRKTKTKEGEE